MQVQRYWNSQLIIILLPVIIIIISSSDTVHVEMRPSCSLVVPLQALLTDIHCNTIMLTTCGRSLVPGLLQRVRYKHFPPAFRPKDLSIHVAFAFMSSAGYGFQNVSIDRRFNTDSGGCVSTTCSHSSN